MRTQIHFYRSTSYKIHTISKNTHSLFPAVSEWLESEDSFHMMRDHPMHDIGMLGSAWGVKLLKDKVRLKWRKAWKDGFQDGDGLMWKARNLTGKF